MQAEQQEGEESEGEEQAAADPAVRQRRLEVHEQVRLYLPVLSCFFGPLSSFLATLFYLCSCRGHPKQSRNSTPMCWSLGAYGALAC